MSEADKLTFEIRTAAEGMLAEGRVVSPTWLTNRIVQNHQDLSGTDALWATTRSYEAVRAAVGKYIRSQRLGEGDADADRQTVLPGYERLQRHYSVDRDGEQALVPLELLTRSEALSKLQELERMRAGLEIHLNEFRRWFDDRFTDAA